MKFESVKVFFVLYLFLFCFLFFNLYAGDQENNREKQIVVIKAKILQFILNNSKLNDRIRIELNSLPKNLPVSLDSSISVSCRKQGQINGKTIFTIYYEKEKGLRDSFQIVATIKRYSRVSVLTKTVNRNHVIQDDDLISIIHEVNWPDTETPVSTEDAVGKRVKRRIQKDRVLTNSMLEEVPLIERGKSLYMDVNLKNLSITIPVISHGQGIKGDIIKVRNVTNGVFYLAEILNKNTVIFKSNKR